MKKHFKKLKQTNKHINVRLPKRTKFKRQHKSHTSGFDFNSSSNKISYGNYGFKILKAINLQEIHVKAIRNILLRKRFMKKKTQRL